MSNTTLDGLFAKAVAKAEQESLERRQRVVKGSHLLPTLLELVTTNSDFLVEDKTGFHHVRNATDAANGIKNKQLCIARRGGRVTLAGFTLDSPAVVQISEEQAKAKHLGRVRGEIDFDKSDDEILGAFKAALAVLAVVTPVVEKPKRAPKAVVETPAPVTETPAPVAETPVAEIPAPVETPVV
jgi:hypothetical protein